VAKRKLEEIKLGSVLASNVAVCISLAYEAVGLPAGNVEMEEGGAQRRRPWHIA